MVGPFLEEISASSRAELERRSSKRSWQAGKTLFHLGDPPSHVYVITDGLVKITVGSETGIEVGLALKGPGELLGELGSIDGAPRSATATAVQPVFAMVLETSAFRALLDSRADVAVAVLSHTVENLRGTSRRQAEFGASDATARLARLLVDLATTYGTSSGRDVEVRLLSQEEMASFCGASREAIARGLKRLRDDGLLTTGRKVVRIHDLDALGMWTVEDVD